VNRGRELLVGTVIIVAASVAVFGTLWLERTNFFGGPSTPVYVLLESVAQLSTGNPVTFRGVPIGQVSAIAVEPGGQGVRVTLMLDPDVPLPADAGVVLGPESLFGGWQAEVVSRASFPRFPFFEVPPGTPTDTAVYPGYALPEISRLTASAEQISVNLADLTDRLELAFNQETADNLARAITNIEAITQEVRTLVQQQGEVAASITASADSALTEVEAAATAARRSFERFQGVMDDAQIDTILTNIRVASTGIRDITQDLSDPEDGLGVTIGRADSALVRLDRITARLEAGEGSLGRLLVDTTFAVRAEEVLLQLDLLLQDVRENPRRYVRLSIF
jgi:phospholipid/cholesterol/gamma-HCH transport system substrate-binding protein